MDPIRELAERQHGMVARRQLLALGLSDRQVFLRTESERLVQVRRGVYALGHRELTRAAIWMSAVLVCGIDSVLSHRSAAALWGILEWNGPVEVLSPTAGRRRGRQEPGSLRPPLVRKPWNLDSTHVTRVDGIPVTTLARTLVDLAAVLNEAQLSRALNEASVKKLLDVDDLRRVVGESVGRKGIATLRDLVERRHPLVARTRSELEARFLLLLGRIRFPEPQVNVMVAGCEVDFYWPEFELIVELDGRQFHDTPRGFEEDRERTARLELAGKRVLRLTWDMVTNRPAATESKLCGYRDLAQSRNPA
ncbi:MAG: type IV toxin-antitoxin system AbiEi family antitoxin domain-containing protein [Solirubrobacterales bacterium]|nr:type IV toxin-antitoxin system AbiEi family antitoxin domain-containing protein [Solirubrobacterales bacterium]